MGGCGQGLVPADPAFLKARALRATVSHRISSARSGVFYGWVIVAAAWIVLFLAYGLQFSYGVFVKAIEDELGWSRAETALPYSIYVLVYSVLSSATGSATDRFGPRRVVAIGAVVLAIGWSLASRVQEPWQLGMTLGLVAAVGMSGTWVPCNGTVVRWFTRLRGTAVAVSTTGGSFGNLVVPAIAAALVASQGWRWTMAVLALVAGVCILAASRLLIRDPESIGTFPDGDSTAPPSVKDPTAVDVRWTRPFLLVVGAYGLTWLAVFIPFIHAAAFAEDLGVSPVRAATVISAMGLGGIVGRLLAGSISDRFGRYPTLLAMFILETIAFGMFAFATGLELLWPGAVLFGFSYGGGVALFPPLCGDIWGRTHAGAIVGAVFARAGSTAAVGPWLAGWLYDASGNYESSFLFGAVVNLLGFGMVLALALDQRAPRPAT